MGVSSSVSLSTNSVSAHSTSACWRMRSRSPAFPPASSMNRPGVSGELIRWKDLSHGTSLEVHPGVA